MRPSDDRRRPWTRAAPAQSVIESKGCGSQTCHGAPQADFYITCGDNEAQRAFNFAQMRAFVDSPVDDSELLQWPLALTAGGVTHTGGAHF